MIINMFMIRMGGKVMIQADELVKIDTSGLIGGILPIKLSSLIEEGEEYGCGVYAYTRSDSNSEPLIEKESADELNKLRGSRPDE